MVATKSNTWIRTSAFLVAAVIGGSAVRADVPRLIHYQGKLVSAGGAIVAGPVDLRIRLYDDPVNAAPVLFDETQLDVSLNRGLFSLLIGSQTGGGVPDSAFAGDAVYLGVSVDGAAELSPRIRIATAPYAGKSKSAEQLVEPDTANAAVTVASGGRVGVGTASPHASALADFSSTTGGLLPPRMTTIQRDAIGSPAPGLMVYNIDDNCLNVWTGLAWTAMGAPQPAGAISGPTNVCANATAVVYSVGDVGGATSYAWSAPPASTIAGGQGTAFLTVDFGAVSGNVSVTPSNACGSSAATVLPIEVSASPPATPGAISGGTTLGNCGQSVSGTYSINPVAGATDYTWTLPAGATIVSGQGTTAITANFEDNVSGDVSVTADNACGSSAASELAVSPSPPPMPGEITGQQVVCQDTAIAYSIAPVGGATSYTWTVPSGATIVQGQGTPSITVNYSAATGGQLTLQVAASNACGPGAARTLDLEICLQVFSYTGDVATFTVPSGVTSINIQVSGAAGGIGYSGTPGGLGGSASGTLSVTPGQALYVYVGGTGDRPAGGWNGGGNGNNWSETGGGGGATDVRTVGGAWNNSTSLNSRLIVGAGGGGGNHSNPGDPRGGGLSSFGNFPASPSSAGAGGGFGYGGTAANTSAGYPNSGGGGGWYGGGATQNGNTYAGPSGGSSYYGGVTNGSTTPGVRSGNGQAIISW